MENHLDSNVCVHVKIYESRTQWDCKNLDKECPWEWNYEWWVIEDFRTIKSPQFQEGIKMSIVNPIVHTKQEFCYQISLEIRHSLFLFKERVLI